jgi:hypothetical protein
MTQVFTLLGFVAKLAAIETDMKAVNHAIVARACELVAAEAKRVLGEGYPEWPALQPATIARKMRGNSPLLETGENAREHRMEFTRQRRPRRFEC